LILLSPLFAVIAILIKCSSKGSVFYKGLRLGKNCEPFLMLKFRTMKVGSDKFGANTVENDDRVTAVGKFLRKYKLDEFPQLINVLKGEMSLVGHRPEVPWYCLLEPSERVIFTVKPGMVDFASLWDVHEDEKLGTVNSEEVYLKQIRPVKIRLQKKYVREQSFRTDMKILMATAVRIIS
jgi:lipopolysaccharide/colanic/teichoic acid biosynthesis glycosyltransferase